MDVDDSLLGILEYSVAVSTLQVKRINFETLETSLPEQQMRGKQVGELE